MTRRSKYNKETIEELVRDCSNWSEAIRKLGLSVTGGTHRHLKARAIALGVDTSHFTGARWNKGLTQDSHPAIAVGAAKTRIPDDRVFCENGATLSGDKLTKRLLRLGWKYMCSDCGINEWRGKPLTLHLDHINGHHTDNRFENLRFLCPNCHQQTDTWGNRKTTPQVVLAGQ